jgi:hypothetical protein
VFPLLVVLLWSSTPNSFASAIQYLEVPLTAAVIVLAKVSVVAVLAVIQET